MQYRVLKIRRFASKPDGTPYPYGTRTLLTLEGVDGEASFFDKGDFASVKEGDVITGEVTTKGQYKNFFPGVKTAQSAPSQDDFKATVNQKLDTIISLLRPKAVVVDEPFYPKDEPSLDGLPF